MSPKLPSMTCDLLPRPNRCDISDGSVRLPVPLAITVDPADAEAAAVARVLADFTAATTPLRPVIIDDLTTAPGGIVFARRDDGPDNPEGYRLESGENRVCITAMDHAGFFYGAMTLWQLLVAALERSPGGDRIEIPCLSIDDAPVFSWRGLLLDSARHFYSVEDIKRLLDWMAVHKLNRFHWHLTDDQGWRIEIDAFPKLTQIGAYRDRIGADGAPVLDAGTGRPERYGGYYSKAEIADLVAYARARSIMIIPEIDMPGHARAAIAAYPELGADDQAPDGPATKIGFPPHNVFNIDEDTFSFLKTVLGEVMALFPGPYIHIGGDEVLLDRWKASARVQERMRALGLDTEAAAQSYFMNRIATFVREQGRTPIGWDDVASASVPTDMAIMVWHDTKLAAPILKAGHPVILTPIHPCYFDSRQSRHAEDGPAFYAPATVENVYNFDPFQDLPPSSLGQGLLGIQANLWSEFTPDFSDVVARLFPRVAALSEVAWSGPLTDGWIDFASRLPGQLRRYQALGLDDYSRLGFIPHVNVLSSATPKPQSVDVAIESQLGVGDIYVSLDGRDPDPKAQRYQGPLTVALPVQIKARTWIDGQPVGDGIARTITDEGFLQKSLIDLDVGPGFSQAMLAGAPDKTGRRHSIRISMPRPHWVARNIPLSGISRISIGIVGIAEFADWGPFAAVWQVPEARHEKGTVYVRRGDKDGPLLAAIDLAPAWYTPAFTELVADLMVDGEQAPTVGPLDDLHIDIGAPLIPILWGVNRIRLHRTE